MSIPRTFLDWRNAALPAARDVLLDRYARDGLLDMRKVVLVLPTSKARRRMLELLVAAAEQAELILFPPRIVTLGPLPEMLYESTRPFASDLIQKLAWVDVLKSASEAQLREILPRRPDQEDSTGWLDLAGLLLEQHRELAAEGLAFSDVAQQDGKLEYFAERKRWQTLEKLQANYLALLDSLELWDKQTARLFAIKNEQCQTDCDIVLIATADINRVVRQMLGQVAGRVTALIHAPAALADRFDDFGCLQPSAWQHAQLDLDDEQIIVVDSPADQADAVARAIAGYDGRYASDEIVIGVPDERMAAHIVRQLAECDVPARWIVGRRYAETGPYRLLQSVAHNLGERRVPDFAELVRHPDIDAWLTAAPINGDWLAELDAYVANHLQPTVGDFLGPETKYPALATVRAKINALLAPLEASTRAPLGQIAAQLIDLLIAVYGNVEIDRADPTAAATWQVCETLHDVLLEHQLTPERLMPTFTATDAIELVLDEVSSATVDPPADVGQVEMFGWLELPLDEAPALIVTSMNEGFVPKSITSDHFLPDRLRRQLGLVDNVRRYARDSYALSVLLASRESLTLIVGRRNPLGDPINPSRLLLATPAASLADRALALFDPPAPASARRPLAGALTATRELTAIEVPLPVRLEVPPSRISVSGFRSYLACPYRYYLGHVLRLREVDDGSEELDAASFGTLLHDVLSEFGRDEVRHAQTPEPIQEFLRKQLDRCVRRAFGREHLPAVRIQTAQAQARLDAFAHWQAERSQAGWEIVHSESEETTKPLTLFIDGHPMIVSGRIDRIDRHRDSGETVIFDYKTSDKADPPEKAHRKNGDWFNLQLPLYRSLALNTLGIEPPVQVGYIVLPKDTGKVAALLAEWTEDDFADAERVAHETAQLIYDQVFWPPAYPAVLSVEFAAICQDKVLQRNLPGAVASEVSK